MVNIKVPSNCEKTANIPIQAIKKIRKFFLEYIKSFIFPVFLFISIEIIVFLKKKIILIAIKFRKITIRKTIFSEKGYK